MKPSFDVVLCFATALEADGLPKQIAGQSTSVLTTGIGPVNAAFELTRFLAEHSARAVLVCGVGGAYPGSNLEVTDVVCAESETYGDLGADSPEGFLDLRAMGFPLIDGATPSYNRLSLDLFPVARRVPFVTCATCTGSDAKAAELVARTGGAVESMEGAAFVHVARRLGIPVGEIRGISNMVGHRDRAAWRLRDAAAAARAAALGWIEEAGARC